MAWSPLRSTKVSVGTSSATLDLSSLTDLAPTGTLRIANIGADPCAVILGGSTVTASIGSGASLSTKTTLIAPGESVDIDYPSGTTHLAHIADTNPTTLLVNLGNESVRTHG